MNDTESLVSTYLTLRRKREDLKAKYEEEDSTLKQDMSVIENALLEICNSTNTNGLKTSAGSVSRQVKERYFCTDWDHFRKFLETEGSYDLLERRINQRNFKEFMSERKDDGLPPGVNALREFAVVVRKATS